MGINFEAKLLISGQYSLRNSVESWYVTHGLGTPAAGTYTEVRVEQSGASPEEVESVVRQVINDLYGSHWAFIYPPADYERCIGRFGMKLRERVLITRITISEEV